MCVNLAWPLSIALIAIAASGLAQEWPQTRAEKTNYDETSHYDDVVAFLRELQEKGAPVTVQMIGKSFEGKDIPLAIASYPPVSSPAEARRLGKPIVYVQANIHAGEVEGKEAILAVLRRLSMDGPNGLLGKIVLLATPIYNIDGNEKFGPVAVNRPEQDGPALVGHRANGQNLDLNRDAIKAESPEMQAVLAHVYTTWDPDVMMDLHTTDGTRHGWELTYSPPLNPNTDAGIMKFTRDQMIPTIRKNMTAEGLPLFDYGNAEKRGNETAWYTFGEEGRYCTNYVGLRNRIAVLSEATTYIPFKERVHVTDRFVTSVLEYVVSHSKQVMDLTRTADARVVQWGENPLKAPELGVRFAFDVGRTDTVLLEKRSASDQRPPIDSRPKEVERVKMPVYDRFKITKIAKFPAGYLFSSMAKDTVALLRKHGILVERLVEDYRGPVIGFKVSEIHVAEAAFQGHKLVRIEGDFDDSVRAIPAESYYVPTNQPLGILAFHILEPESLDGAIAWGFLPADGLEIGSLCPVFKVMEPLKAATTVVP